MQIGKGAVAESHICQAYADRVEVRGRDLTGDLMGRISFTDYFHLLLTGREATPIQREFLDVLLVSIAEHGMMPTNIAARMTLAADPGSLQGAVAAGILGCGPVILGTAELCAKLLVEARGKGGEPLAAAMEMAAAIKAAGGKAPGFGHPVHRPVDPRAERILELADARGVSGAHVALARAFREGCRQGLGQALGDECFHADCSRDAGSWISGRDGESRAAAGANGQHSGASCRGAAEPDWVSDGGQG